jgi:uncharacterized protein YecE (DUF72 family)
MTDLWVGTSGYSHPEWRGAFFPADLPEEQMLRYYAGHLSTVELNSTFHRLPSVRMLQAWAKETPPRFAFSLKAPRRITHELQLRDAAESVTEFCDTVRVLKAKLGAILLQVPSFLKKDVPRLEDFLHQLPPGFRMAMEFRNPSWCSDEVFECLRRFDIALCITDHDEHATPFEMTGAFAYLRLRRSVYTDEDLAEWTKRLTRGACNATAAYVYFKQDEPARAAVLAAKLAAALQPDVASAAPAQP